MRLLNTTSFELENFSHDALPQQYAILSHSWGNEADEIRFRDVQEGRIKRAQNRPTKLEGCCRIAKDDGYEYIWVDTCCIDNSNSVEVQEAINSMFRWYKDAAICYAFLSDVSAEDMNPWDSNSEFSSSRWFKRGWTLQELLAPPRLRFYNRGWHCLGTKGELCAIVEKATGIPSLHLLGIRALRDASVAQRMSWAAERVTKRPEDIAYSLIGIFGVAMTMIYGEGSRNAFTRLQELIMTKIGDDSILAWGLGQTESNSEPLTDSTPGRILASSPAAFAGCRHIQAREHAARDSFDKFGGSLRLNIPLITSAPDNIYGLLKCGDSGQAVGMPLMNISNGGSDEYIRPHGHHPILVPIPGAGVSPTTILVRTEYENRARAASSGKYWYNVQRSVETGLELIEVWPRSCWRREEALIEAAATSQDDAKQQTFVRFRYKDAEVHDFLVVLELRTEVSQSEAEAQYHVMTCARETSLGAIAEKYSQIRPEATDKQSAGNGMINLQVVLKAVRKDKTFILTTVPLASPPEVTYDATVELQILVAKMEMTLLQEENSVVEMEAAALKETIQETEEILKQTTEELELVNRELSEMEAKKAQLLKRLVEGRVKVESFNHSRETTTSRLESLAKRRSSTQRRLESFSDKSISTAVTGDGGDNDSEAESRLPIFNWAVLNGHLGVVQELLDMKAANIELKSGDREYTPLHLAARHGHHDIALMLLHHGASIDSKDKYGCTPLFSALLAKDKQVVSLLVEKGAKINVQNGNGRLPLHLAAEHGADFAVRLLLERGVDIEAADDYYWTALHETAVYGRLSTAEILIENRAAVNVTSKNSQTPLHKAVMHGYEPISELLIKSGANVDAKDSLAKTPLHLACQGGFLAVAELLLQKDASIEARASCNETPLNIAAEKGHEGIVELLVQKGASMASNKDGMSPLHWAAITGNEAITMTLLKSSAAIYLNQLTSSGDSPLDFALRNDHKGTAKLLSSYGAMESSKINSGIARRAHKSSYPSLPPREPTSPGTVVNGDDRTAARTSVADPTFEDAQHPVVGRPQYKSPTAFQKLLKRRKAT